MDSCLCMNVIFMFCDDELMKIFVQEVKEVKMIGFGGYCLVGGCCVFIYNVVFFEDCEKLVVFMKKFQ